MKKIFGILCAAIAMSLSFTGCGNDGLMTADPELQPIAGKTYISTDSKEGGYVQFTFLKNYKCIIEVQAKAGAQITKKDLFTWYMSLDDTKEITIRYAQGTIERETGLSLSNKLIYTGTYDEVNKTVTLTDVTDEQQETYICHEK